MTNINVLDIARPERRFEPVQKGSAQFVVPRMIKALTQSVNQFMKLLNTVAVLKAEQEPSATLCHGSYSLSCAIPQADSVNLQELTGQICNDEALELINCLLK